MANEKLRGIYLRGNIFWLTHGSGANRKQVSLETSDYAEAVANAQKFLDNPVLNTTEGFVADLNNFAHEQTTNGVWTKNSKNIPDPLLTQHNTASRTPATVAMKARAWPGPSTNTQWCATGSPRRINQEPIFKLRCASPSLCLVFGVFTP